MDNRQKISLSNHVKKVRKVRVREEIVSQIRTLIEEGKLRPGDRLPPERELCGLFSVSRHSVREALRSLERSRMINSIPGSGNYVAMNESEAAKGMIASYLFDKKDELMEIFQIRKMIEPQVAKLAAQNAQKKNLDQMESLMKKNKALLLQKTIDQKNFSNLDKELHLEIAKATQSSIIPKLVERLSDLFSESRHESILSESRMKVSCQGHIDLIQAILDRDEKRSFKLMENHLDMVETEAIRHLMKTTLKKTGD